MKKTFQILLIGSLSILFAEVFSGASQTWFINGWGLLLTFPLYLAHVLFVLWIALKFKKTSLSQLYIFGMIFALYESWITKVLWVGYMDSTGPGLGTFLGIGIPEFPILTFFWHPIMSFILPILVFEILAGKTIKDHEKVLRKTTNKSTIIIVFLILISTFIANGNQFNIISSNASLIGTLIIVFGLYNLSKNANLKEFEFKKISFIMISIYLVLLYIITFIFLLPERIPQTIMPYATIIIFYIFLVFLTIKSKSKEILFLNLDNTHYSAKNLITFALITIFAVNVACLSPSISLMLLMITYFVLALVGTIIFTLIIYRILKNKFKQIKM